MMMTRTNLFAYLAWTQALLGLLGSLFFSEVMGLLPCNLCWYQRIALYPLVLIIGIGVARKDPQYLWYAWPLAVIGWVIAVYHNLIYYHIVPAAEFTCNDLVPCTTPFAIFGWFSIPLLSLLAFTSIIVCLYMEMKSSSLTSLPHESRS